MAKVCPRLAANLPALANRNQCPSVESLRYFREAREDIKHATLDGSKLTPLSYCANTPVDCILFNLCAIALHAILVRRDYKC